MADSLKADICCRRGKAVRRRVVPTSAVSVNLQGFLCVDDNKTELFSFLASNMADTDTNERFITTIANRQEVSTSSACTPEEADTSILIILMHLHDVVQQGYSKLPIGTVNTDVVVLAIASANRLNVSELYGLSLKL